MCLDSEAFILSSWAKIMVRHLPFLGTGCPFHGMLSGGGWGKDFSVSRQEASEFFSCFYEVTYCPWARFDITCSKYPNLLYQPLGHQLPWLLAQACFAMKSVCRGFVLRFVLFLASTGFKENCRDFLMLRKLRFPSVLRKTAEISFP